MKERWWKHGLLNTTEHVATRLADAAASLLIIAVLSPERLGALASAQAWVAPLLFLAITPETILYRDYADLKASNRLKHYVSAFRRFAELKALVLLVLPLLVAALLGRTTEELFALAWAFALPLGTQLLGPERETLRLGLEMKRLNQLTLIQKGLFFSATAFGALVWSTSLLGLALCVWLSFLLSLGLARLWVGVSFQGESAQGLPSAFQIWLGSLKGFSGAHHLIGVCVGWIQTMDLFFLSLFATDSRTLGLYSVVLKLTNFSYAVPVALANLYSIRLGRAKGSRSIEQSELKRLTFGYVIGVGVQCLAGILLGGVILRLLSRGRWSELENTELHGWFVLTLLGATWSQLPLLHNAWLAVRASLFKLFTQVALPWLLLAIVVYWGVSQIAPRDPGAMAAANVLVGSFFLVLIAIRLRFERQSWLSEQPTT